MVAQSPPYAEQNAQHDAKLFRLATFSAWRDASGIVGPTDLGVTAQPTPNMSIQVAAGRAWIKGTQVSSVAGGSWSTQGAYYCYNDAPVTLTVAAADPTNPRIDAVVAYALDAFYSGASNLFVLGVVTGTPAASPAAPAVPSNGLLLGTLAVAANATSIAAGNIAAPSSTLQTVARGGILPVLAGDTTPGVQTGQYRDHPARGLERWNLAASLWQPGDHISCTSTTRPASPTDGLLIYETDTKAYGFFEAASGRWVMYDTVWQTYTPTLSVNTAPPWTAITLGNGSLFGAYYRKGREVTVKLYFLFGTTTSYGGATGPLRFSMPTGLVAKAMPFTTAGYDRIPCGQVRGLGTANVDGFFAVDALSTYAAADRRLLMTSSADVLAAGGSTSWGISAGGHLAIGQATYETNFEA